MTNFVLAPVITQAFEAIFESAYILKMLLVELGTKGSEKQFISMNYDGSVRSSPRTEVIGGTEAIETGMKNHLSVSDSENRSLESAVRLALETWAIGRDLSLQADDLSEEDEQGNESHLNEDQLRDVLKRGIGRWAD